jgi:hypothetical protein
MTTQKDDCRSLTEGDIRFYDNYVPSLGVGDYIINVTQQVNPKNTTTNECHAASQVFSVQGPRYTLPPDDIFSTFPPNNAQGVFDQFLPHVVMTKRDLLWENNVFFDAAAAKQTPWMALLLFVEDEVQKPEQPPAVGDFLLAPAIDGWVANRTMVGGLKASAFYNYDQNKVRSPKSQPDSNGILWPELEVEWYEADDYLDATVCSFIDLSPQAFATLIPSKSDLRYLAHARQVDPSAKDSSVLKVTGDGWYSVLIGNRLADAPVSGQPGKRNIVHLVSLEGFQQYINESTIAALPNDAKRVRMISFQSWTFTCLPEAGESFSELMLGLLNDEQGNVKSTRFMLPTDTLKSGESEETQYASQAIERGYVPMRYQTRMGEQTFGWYRGPLSPVPVKNFISVANQGPTDPGQQTGADPVGWVPFDTASSALIYDKDYGVFDLSYAVAWETGRLLALSNPYFGQELLDWQRKGHRLLDLIMERRTQIAALKNFDPNNPDAPTEKSLLDQIEAYAVTGGFMSYLVTQFSKQIEPKTSGQPTDSPAAPLPPYPDTPSPPANPQTIADLLQETDVQAAVRDLGGQELDSITDWLAQLYLLIGVPFENLVPHAALLPAESVRFFYLDSNWHDSLVEGALSIGVESSRDRLYQDLMKDLIWNTVFTAVQTVRDRLLGDFAKVVPEGSSVPLDQESLTGMLLRSAVVSGWPGLEVTAYARYTLDEQGSARPDISTEIKPLRIERLSNDILLCLWPTVPAAVSLDEPREGVAFGFEDPPGKKKDQSGNGGEGYYLYLRSLENTNYGMPLCSDEDIEENKCQHQIDVQGQKLIDPNRILNIAGLLPAIQSILGSSTPLRVADFAVQMIKVPEQAVFASPPAKK